VLRIDNPGSQNVTVLSVCGLAKDGGGAADFVTGLQGLGVNIIRPKKHLKIHSSMRQGKVLQALTGLIGYFFIYIEFAVRVLFQRKRDLVIIYHPQSIGLLLTIFLIFFHRRCLFYVLDNFLFCRRSYNFHQRAEGECLRCINESKPFDDCRVSPGLSPSLLYTLFLKAVRHRSNNFKLLFQNKSQEALHRIVYPAIASSRVGLFLPEFTADYVRVPNRAKTIVFHGSAIPQKGIEKFFALASMLTEFEFIVPASPMSGAVPDNIKFVDVTWDTGLQDLVEAATAIFCATQWSAPIEAALVKSVIHNGLVIVQDTKHGWANDLPRDAFIYLRPCLDVSGEEADEVRGILESADKTEFMRGKSIQALASAGVEVIPDELISSLNSFTN
jgi:hypothetical protein